METGKAWKDELKVVLFRQKYGVWWVCKLNTDMSEKANLSGENRYDSTNLVSKVVGVDKDSFAYAQFVAESQNKADSTSRAGYGFHNDGITGGFLYLDNDHKLKFIDVFGEVHVIVMESP